MSIKIAWTLMCFLRRQKSNPTCSQNLRLSEPTTWRFDSVSEHDRFQSQMPGGLEITDCLSHLAHFPNCPKHTQLLTSLYVATSFPLKFKERLKLHFCWQFGACRHPPLSFPPSSIVLPQGQQERAHLGPGRVPEGERRQEGLVQAAMALTLCLVTPGVGTAKQGLEKRLHAWSALAGWQSSPCPPSACFQMKAATPP